jgi:hypothetical protein
MANKKSASFLARHVVFYSVFRISYSVLFIFGTLSLVHVRTNPQGILNLEKHTCDISNYSHYHHNHHSFPLITTGTGTTITKNANQSQGHPPHTHNSSLPYFHTKQRIVFFHVSHQLLLNVPPITTLFFF